MSHLPFIWAAYSIGTVVLLWCAFAPLVRKKSAVQDIRRLIQQGSIQLDGEKLTDVKGELPAEVSGKVLRLDKKRSVRLS